MLCCYVDIKYDVSEGIDINKTGSSCECFIHSY